jgi:predicted dehydrogenase
LKSDPIGTALVGVGHVADTHAQALAALPESRFVGVFDSNTHRALDFAARYGVMAYRSLDELLEDDAVQSVSVAVPHRVHGEVAIDIANAGRHVIVEKPMASTLAECDAMIAAAESNHVQLALISQRRWYEPVRRVKAAIDEGRIGRPILATLVLLEWRGPDYYAMDPWRGTWGGEGGGILVSQATHQLDILQWFMGPVVEVDGYAANLSHPTIEVEDTVVALLRFANGALGSIVASNSQTPGLYGQIHIHGDNGASIGVQTESGSAFVSGVTTHVDSPFNDLWTIPGEADSLPRWRRSDRARVRGDDVMTRYHRLQIQDFLDAIASGREPAVSGREGRKSVELFTALYRAQRSARRVTFPVRPDALDGTSLA